jgi:SAM-dependent methyltransferase
VKVGSVRFGDLRRLRPVSRTFGFDRGTPVDRWYIERFLDRHRLAIRGRVLEIGDDRYTREFGGDRVERSDVLHVDAGQQGANLVADLAAADHLPADTWDAIVCTQTLHLVYDVQAALATLHRILKPGGTLLVSVPGISPISDDRWRESWYWSFTALSWRRLVEAAFVSGSIEVRTHGNVLAATAFLHGLAAEEVEGRELDAYDPRYPVVVVASAVKGDPQAPALRRDTAPLVSVVIPCHDQADTVEEAIASVELQTHPRWELIVVDDGSTDDSARVASAHPAVKLVRQENRGLAAARNAGLAAAAGDLVVFLDADDRLLPGALDAGAAAFADHPECALVCGHHRTIAGDGSLQAQWPAFHPAGGHYYGLLQGNFIAAIHSAMFRREALEAIGGFDPSLRAAEDYDLYLGWRAGSRCTATASRWPSTGGVPRR